MASDRARDTYDDRRQYRRVIQQQGRVVLEAELPGLAADIPAEAYVEYVVGLRAASAG